MKRGLSPFGSLRRNFSFLPLAKAVSTHPLNPARAWVRTGVREEPDGCAHGSFARPDNNGKVRCPWSRVDGWSARGESETYWCDGKRAREREREKVRGRELVREGWEKACGRMEKGNSGTRALCRVGGRRGGWVDGRVGWAVGARGCRFRRGVRRGKGGLYIWVHKCM